MAAKKKPAAALEGVAGEESVEGQSTPESPTGSGEPPAPEKPLTDDERVARSRATKLEEKTGELAQKLQQAEARASGLEGELQRARQALTSAESQVVDLSAKLAAATNAARNAGQKLEGLPDGARQVNESVTIATITRGGAEPRRAQIKQGDVVLVTRDDAEVAELQQKLGLTATVWKVTEPTVRDLEQGGFLHK